MKQVDHMAALVSAIRNLNLVLGNMGVQAHSITITDRDADAAFAGPDTAMGMAERKRARDRLMGEVGQALKSSPTYVQAMRFEVAPPNMWSNDNLEVMGVKIKPRSQEG